MAEVEPADYVPLFLHRMQSRIFDKYALDRRFLRYLGYEMRGKAFHGSLSKTTNFSCKSVS